MAVSQTSISTAANLYSLTDSAAGNSASGEAPGVEAVQGLSKALGSEKAQASQILAMLTPNLGRNVDLRI